MSLTIHIVESTIATAVLLSSVWKESMTPYFLSAINPMPIRLMQSIARPVLPCASKWRFFCSGSMVSMYVVNVWPTAKRVAVIF